MAQTQVDACAVVRACAADDAWCSGACSVIPAASPAREEALAALDREARSAAGEHNYDVAAQRFTCLFRADPRAENVGSLSVVLRERGLMGDALTAARCAESLSNEGPGRERARARREDIERRVAPAKVPSPEQAARTMIVEEPARPSPLPRDATARARQSEGVLVTSSRSTDQEPPAGFRRAGWIGAAAAAVLVVGAGTTYLLARERSSDFRAEQAENGFTQRAQDLRSGAQSWRTVSAISLTAGVLVSGASAVLVF
ncbi:MAG TPA: hypothetical protein VFH73_17340 [Polyangia bacterium]|nr:hypothetical protein [Polyangia bacterium]